MCECVSSGADGVVDAMASLEHAFEVGVVVMGDGSVKVCVCATVSRCSARLTSFHATPSKDVQRSRQGSCRPKIPAP